jgi:hypothetical protein
LLQNSKIKNKVAVISIDSPGSEKMYDLIKNSNPNYICTTFGKNGDFKSEDPELNINKTIYALKIMRPIIILLSILLVITACTPKTITLDDSCLI